MNRETRKNRLRQQVVMQEQGAESGQKRRRPFKWLLGIVVVLLLLGIGFCFYQVHRHSTAYETVWEKDFAEGGQKAEAFVGYETFAKGFIRYSKDGAAYYNADGKTIWERSYQLDAPVAAVSAKYAAIADQGGSKIYIFNESGNTGAVSTVRPVRKVTIADTGLVYAILQDDSAEYITAFRYDGSPIDLSVKSVLTGDGYPIDIAVSPDGSQLITTYAAIENGAVVNRVVFRNFGEIGKNADARRIVGGFSDDFAGHMAGRVYFSDDSHAQAFYDGGIVFFSTKVLTSPSVLKKVSFSDPILSIAMSKDYVAVILARGQENGEEETESAAQSEAESGNLKRAAAGFGSLFGTEAMMMQQIGGKAVSVSPFSLNTAAVGINGAAEGGAAETTKAAEGQNAAETKPSGAQAEAANSNAQPGQTNQTTAPAAEGAQAGNAEAQANPGETAANHTANMQPTAESTQTAESKPDTKESQAAEPNETGSETNAADADETNKNDSAAGTLYQLQVFKTNGQKIGEANFSTAYTAFEIQGKAVLLYSDSSLQTYGLDGRERASLELKNLEPAKVVRCGRGQNEFLVAGSSKLARIRLK